MTKASGTLKFNIFNCIIAKAGVIYRSVEHVLQKYSVRADVNGWTFADSLDLDRSSKAVTRALGKLKFVWAVVFQVYLKQMRECLRRKKS